MATLAASTEALFEKKSGQHRSSADHLPRGLRPDDGGQQRDRTRVQPSPLPTAQEHLIKANINKSNEKVSSLETWVLSDHWPKDFDIISDVIPEPKIEYPTLIARPGSYSYYTVTSKSFRTRSSYLRSQRARALIYQSPQYTQRLKELGLCMSESSDIADESKQICRRLLTNDLGTPSPWDFVGKNASFFFREDKFSETCSGLRGTNDGVNEAKLKDRIGKLLVPSAEDQAYYGEWHLRNLIGSVYQKWDVSIPIVGVQPRPDYAVGFRRQAFTAYQLKKLAPIIGDLARYDMSCVMGTHYMYFPFFAREVKFGAEGLEFADRLNAHCMGLAARGVFELFRFLKREAEVEKQILSFSVSYNEDSVWIYGYYPVTKKGSETQYHRHTIESFKWTDSKNKWTCCRFMQSLYNLWAPKHFEQICSAIEQIPNQEQIPDEAFEGDLFVRRMCKRS